MMNSPAIGEMQACPVSRERINSVFEAHGLQCYTYMTVEERRAIQHVQQSIPDYGNSCWMDAFLALWQWHNCIGEYAPKAIA